MKKLLPVMALLLFGCSEKAAETESDANPAYSRQYRSGSLTAIVSLSETNIPSSGKITAAVEIHTPAGIEPVVPNLSSFIDPFSVADGYGEPAQKLPNGRIRRRLVWILVPALPGGTVFQPLEIRAGGEQIKTEPIPVRVTSIIPAGLDEPDFRDIAGPMELLPEQQQKRRAAYTVIGSVLVLCLIPILLVLFRRRQPPAAVLPREDALRALAALPENPVERIHECSRIFRVYYEARFGTPIMGRTAVELAALLEDMEMIRFLEQCDAVRFSNRVPPGFAAEAELFVRQYIEKNREVPE